MRINDVKLQTVIRNTLKEAANVARVEAEQVALLIDEEKYVEAHAKLVSLNIQPSSVTEWVCAWNDEKTKEANQ